MKQTEVMCPYCEKIFDIFDEVIKIEQATKPAENIHDIINENKTFAIKCCPHCNKPNELYYYFETVFLTRKGKKCYMKKTNKEKIIACVYSCPNCQERRKNE